MSLISLRKDETLPTRPRLWEEPLGGIGYAGKKKVSIEGRIRVDHEQKVRTTRQENYCLSSRRGLLRGRYARAQIMLARV